MDATPHSLPPVRQLAIQQTHKAMKTKLIQIARTNGEIVYLNPTHITAIEPAKDEQTRVHYFGWTSFVGSNLCCLTTPESVEGLAKRIQAQ
jgi:hypothetical protein